MKRASKFIAAALPLGLVALCAAPSQAQDASFGCKVLLCAAATNPSWGAIPYCVPPMTQLFSILNKGGSWPSCPEGNVSAVQYTPYQACPAGWTAQQLEGGTNNAGNGGYVTDPNGSTCTNLNAPDSQCHQGSCTTTYPEAARQANPDPYCVDIGASSGGTQTHFCFSLSGG